VNIRASSSWSWGGSEDACTSPTARPPRAGSASSASPWWTFAWPAERRAGIRALPTSLGQALDALALDNAFLTDGGVFSAEMLDRWIAKKRHEERSVLNRPHPYEVELYYDL